MGSKRKRQKLNKMRLRVYGPYGAVLLLWVLLTGYQNCGPVQFTLASNGINGLGGPCLNALQPTPNAILTPASGISPVTSVAFQVQTPGAYNTIKMAVQSVTNFS